MSFTLHAKKGLARCSIDDALRGEPLHFHISAVAAGHASHAPHQHDGTEAIYLLAGEATLTLGDETLRLQAGESVIFDPRRLHDLVNSGPTINRYMVIIGRDS
ncbi:MAG: cupin domain-containing protein [Undibacterium sp.]|nr:cupin domain-containing protein [Opitutaceae bacterium]